MLGITSPWMFFMSNTNKISSEEFKNSMIDNLLKTFSISRSLSKKGCPYYNSIAEATFTEFVFNRMFRSFEELET